MPARWVLCPVVVVNGRRVPKVFTIPDPGRPPYEVSESPKVVDALTRLGNVATARLPIAHRVRIGGEVTILGADQSDYNGRVTVTDTSPAGFSYLVFGTPLTPATGLIAYRRHYIATPTYAHASTVRGAAVPGEFCLSFARGRSIAGLTMDPDVLFLLEHDHPETDSKVDRNRYHLRTPAQEGWSMTRLDRTLARMESRNVPIIGITRASTMRDIVIRCGQSIQPSFNPERNWCPRHV